MENMDIIKKAKAAIKVFPNVGNCRDSDVNDGNFSGFYNRTDSSDWNH